MGGGRIFEQIKDGLHTKFESLVGQKFVWFFITVQNSKNFA